jgi:hypothetical protein
MPTERPSHQLPEEAAGVSSAHSKWRARRDRQLDHVHTAHPSGLPVCNRQTLDVRANNWIKTQTTAQSQLLGNFRHQKYAIGTTRQFPPTETIILGDDL